MPRLHLSPEIACETSIISAPRAVGHTTTRYTPRVFRTTERPFLSGVLAGLAHGVVMALAFPRPGVWPLCLFAAVPLMLLARRASDRTRRAALGAGLGTLPFWLLTHLYIWEISDAGLPVLLLYLCVWPGLFVWIAARFAHMPRLWMRAALPALLWTGLEALRAQWVWEGYPWYLIGQPLIDSSYTMLAPLTGILGASLFTAAFNSGVTILFDEPRRPLERWRPRVAVALFACLIGLFIPLRPSGWASRGTPTDVRVGVVQTNVPQSNKMAGTFDDRMRDFSAALRLTSDAAHDDPKPDLIVWPETSFPGFSLSPDAVEAERASGLGYREKNFPLTGWHDELVDLQGKLGVPILIGAIAAEGYRIETEESTPRIVHDRLFNSAFLIEGGKVSPQRSDKVHLTPFGETMPHISRWKWLEQRLLALGAAGMTFDLSVGSGMPIAVPLASGAAPIRIAAPICFEATTPGVVRGIAFPTGPDASGKVPAPAGLIINLTNDGWFGTSITARLNHLLCARWRCVELGLPMIRCANTGASCLIDAGGRVLQLGPNDDAGTDRPAHGSMVEGVMSVTVPVVQPPEGASAPILPRAFEWAMPFVGALFVLWRATIGQRAGLAAHAPAPGNA